MKIVLCLVLLFGVCYCHDDSQQSSNYWREVVHDDAHDGHQKHEPIERPCSLHDINCIRHFFAHNSRCSPVHGPAPDPYWIKTIPLQMPHVNLSFALNDVRITGFNDWKIKEFYINKKTDKLVLEVVFDSIKVYSDKTVLTYYRKGKEPMELSDVTFIDYRDLSLTLTVSHVRDIKLSRAHVFTHLSDAAPDTSMGPNFMESKVPLARTVHDRLLKNIGLTLQEAFVTQGPVFMSIFLQTSICDFNEHP